MIDNSHLIKPILNFEKEGDFYMLSVFKRKKDQPDEDKENHQIKLELTSMFKNKTIMTYLWR
jgi:hypothetical protein